MIVTCRNCGSKCEIVDNYCRHCGALLDLNSIVGGDSSIPSNLPVYQNLPPVQNILPAGGETYTEPAQNIEPTDSGNNSNIVTNVLLFLIVILIIKFITG
jgi:hypothetical protein